MTVRKLSIQEFIPSLQLLKQMMETETIPPLPTEEETAKINELKSVSKQLIQQYYEISGGDFRTPINTPEAIQLRAQMKENQTEFIPLNEVYEEKIRLHNFHRYVHILIKHNLKPLLESFFSPLNNGMPSVTYFLLKYDDVSKNIEDPDDFIFFRKFDVIPFIVDKRPIDLVVPVQIPHYNLLHVGNICHFNSCINILSSMTLLIAKLADLNKSYKLKETAKNIYQYLLNAHSYIDLNPSLLLSIASELKIPMGVMEEATETMKKLMSCLYASGLPLEETFFWDSTDQFYKQNELTHQLSTKLSELKPDYFLCSIHDFNSIYNIDSRTIELQAFDVTDDDNKVLVSYTLSSFIMFNASHYVSAFISPAPEKGSNGEQLFNITVLNDLNHRYDIHTVPISYAFRGWQHVLGCYVRSDLLPASQLPEPTSIEPVDLKLAVDNQ